MANHYFLNKDHTYTPCSMMKWASQFEDMSMTNTKHVAEDIIDGKHVSTVWLGLNHNYFGGPPLVFETMVFDEPKGGHDIYCDRYTTWDEALEGHKKAVEWVKAGCNDDEL